MLLDEIINNKKGEVSALKDQFKFIRLQNLADAFPPLRDFKPAIKKDGKIALIAEIKKASPSAGVIVPDFNPPVIAKAYEAAGATAISVLTDDKYFKGLLSHLKKVKEAVQIPVLRKDFIIDEMQILESRLAGADALLLIARILDGSQLKHFIGKCKEINLSTVLEIHDEHDAEKALLADPDIIGINNRDLDTLKVNIETSFKLLKEFPELKSKILVSESGISSASQINELKSAGFSAVLVGESILKSGSFKDKIKELLG